MKPDPITAKLIEQDRALRDAIKCLHNLETCADADLLAACTTVETHTRNPEFLRRAATVREAVQMMPKPEETQ